MRCLGSAAVAACYFAMSAVLAVASLFAVAEGAAVKLIIDTDASGDCDDVGAICIANALADNGEAELLAVMHNTGIEHGAGAISVLNTYYGRGDVPIGAYKGDFDS